MAGIPEGEFKGDTECFACDNSQRADQRADGDINQRCFLAMFRSVVIHQKHTNANSNQHVE